MAGGEANVDANTGFFSFDAIPEGTYTPTVITQFGDPWGSGTAVAVTGGATTTTTIDLTGFVGGVVGKITVGGEPLTAGSVGVQTRDGGSVCCYGIGLDSTGQFRLFLPAGHYTAGASSACCPLGTFEFDAIAGVTVDLSSGETPAGNDVQVSLNGGLSQVGGIQATFSTVESSGFTTVAVSGVGPPPPTAFKIVGIAAQPTYYDINTTATFSGPIEVCIRYDDGQVHGPESRLKLMHHDGTGFVNITTSVDTVSNVICGVTTSVSPFAVMEPSAAPVGGIAGLPDVSSSSGPNHGLLAAAVAAVLLALSASACYARRRWLA
jgi:hypothetical protein